MDHNFNDERVEVPFDTNITLKTYFISQMIHSYISQMLHS